MSAKVHLCDGDCGNCYEDKDLNSTCYGENLCRECMFRFMAAREHEEHQP